LSCRRKKKIIEIVILQSELFFDWRLERKKNKMADEFSN
jgi:hypothetical protein